MTVQNKAPLFMKANDLSEIESVKLVVRTDIWEEVVSIL